MKWTSISEYIPVDKMILILYYKGNKTTFGNNGRFITSGRFVKTVDGDFSVYDYTNRVLSHRLLHGRSPGKNKVTHWALLPNMPEE